MNKPLLGSIVAATLLLGDASAATMYERFETMEKEMVSLQSELETLRAEKAAAEEAAAKAAEEEADEPEDDEEGEEDDEAEDGEDEEEEEDSIEDIIEELEESVHDINRATAGNHLKFSVDFRTTYDAVNYEMADGTRAENNDIFTNRLWLNMNWAANENMSFTGQLAYNKMYGARFGDTGPYSSFDTFDWFTSTNPSSDGNVRVKSAYWFYRNDTFLGGDTPWTLSIGRRPSTNGHLINFRDNDPAASPSGHTINVEFDGVSSKFSFEKLTGVEGMYIKFCGGQGSTNADEKFSPTPAAHNFDYVTDGFNPTGNGAIKPIHMAGLIFVPYDNGQFSIGTQFTGASNMPGQNFDGNPASPSFGAMTGLTPVGDLYTGTMYMMLNGIGDEWTDFLDDTTFFVSGAATRTNPDDGLDQFGNKIAMLGSTEMETGHSYWAGLNMPSLFSEEGRFGLEYNHGSKYWRPITYAEDTLIGSKIAARGDAYEIYFTEPLLEEAFSLQVRYTYIDYEYSGSNGFFGNVSGTPLTMDEAVAFGQGGNVVDVAQDLRVYLRYQF